MTLEMLCLDNLLAFVLCFIGIAIFLEERQMNMDSRTGLDSRLPPPSATSVHRGELAPDSRAAPP